MGKPYILSSPSNQIWFGRKWSKNENSINMKSVLSLAENCYESFMSFINRLVIIWTNAKINFNVIGKIFFHVHTSFLCPLSFIDGYNRRFEMENWMPNNLSIETYKYVLSYDTTHPKNVSCINLLNEMWMKTKWK